MAQMDDRLDIIYAKTALLAIIESMKISIDELKKSNKPTAGSYIKGMTKYVQKMNEVYITLNSMEEEINVLKRMNYNYHKQAMELNFKLKDLQSEIRQQKDEI